MHAAASDPLIWEQHSERNRHERPVFQRFFDGAMACGGGLTVIDTVTGKIVGSSRFYDWDSTDDSVVIGYTFLARSHWGTGANREMKDLMMTHAFQYARRVWFHVSKDNMRSRRAVEKLGATLDREASVPVGGVPAMRCLYRLDRPASTNFRE